MFPFQRLQSWKLPSPGVQETPQPGPRESDRSPTPSTMDYPHHAPAPAGPHPLESLPAVPMLQHPHNGQVFSHRSGTNAHLLRPQTSSPSLVPSDVHHDRSFLRRMKDFFTAALERLGEE